MVMKLSGVLAFFLCLTVICQAQRKFSFFCFLNFFFSVSFHPLSLLLSLSSSVVWQQRNNFPFARRGVHLSYLNGNFYAAG
jgi:hypothetical protein